MITEAINSLGWDLEIAKLKADLQKDSGDLDGADATWQDAVGELGESATAWIERGKIARDAGNLAHALDCLDRAVHLDVNNAYAASHMGLVLESMGRLEEALDCQQRALKLKPDSGMYAMCVGKLHAKLQNSNEAAEYFRMARPLMAGETAYNCACLEALAGEPEAALKHLAAFIAANPFGKAWARQDSDLETLRHLGAFQLLLS